MARGKLFWTAYRKHYARELLARGASMELLADRLGLTVVQARHGVSRYRLWPELADG
jgi:hypothetical protein